MSDLSQVAVYSDSSELYKNVFCNPAFELEGEREERVEGFRTTSSTPEPIKPPAAGRGLFGVCVMRGPACGWVVVAAVCVLLAALGLALALVLTQMKGRAVEDASLSTGSPVRPNAGDGASQTLSTTSASRGPPESTSAPPPTGAPTPETRCGGVLFDSEGSFSSPNHPGSYPPNLLCVWVIRVAPPSLVQIHVTSLTVEGPSPCLFDWLEVQEQIEQSAVVTRFCGNVAPPTVNTNSSAVRVTFRSDGSIAGNGFTAQYRAVRPAHKSCSREEFMCDGGRCLLRASVCDGRPNCRDRADEANCSHKRKGESA
uniref:CUB domain-containing protein n=1 Tax=Gasterosteus aculeatus aculeatus TaxID=481459 RepID=A0AAQ4QWL8_GASAC